MRVLVLIILGTIAVFAATCIVRLDNLTVGALLDPPQPGGSIFIATYGFPLPVYAQNHDARIGPTGSKVFWANARFNLGVAFVGTAIFAVALVAIRAILRFGMRLPGHVQ